MNIIDEQNNSNSKVFWYNSMPDSQGKDRSYHQGHVPELNRVYRRFIHILLESFGFMINI